MDYWGLGLIFYKMAQNKHAFTIAKKDGSSYEEIKTQLCKLVKSTKLMVYEVRFLITKNCGDI